MRRALTVPPKTKLKHLARTEGLGSRYANQSPLRPTSLTIHIDAAELTQVLQRTPAEQNVMLVGAHGIGKSEIIRDHYRCRSMKVVPFFLGQMSDPGDLIGLMNKDPDSGRSEFLPPAWWPADDEPIVLFLDELNRARPEILQSVMELALDKTLAGRRLPVGSVVISAVNDGDEYQLTDLDPALVSRFNVYHFRPTAADWFAWANDHKVDGRLIEFLRQHPHWLDGQSTQSDAPETGYGSALDPTADRRGWARVSKLIAEIETFTPLDWKLIAGVVGTAAVADMRRWMTARPAVSAADVLADDGVDHTVVAELTVQQTVALNEQLLRQLSSNQEISGETAAQRLLQYLLALRSAGFNESIAHFISILDQPEHATANAIFAESIELSEFLADAIEP